MAKVDKIDTQEAVVEKSDKKSDKKSKKSSYSKKKRLKKIFLMELLMCNLHLITL